MIELETKESESQFVLSEEQMKEIERRRSDYLAGKGNWTRLEDAMNMIGKNIKSE